MQLHLLFVLTGCCCMLFECCELSCASFVEVALISNPSTLVQPITQTPVYYLCVNTTAQCSDILRTHTHRVKFYSPRLYGYPAKRITSSRSAMKSTVKHLNFHTALLCSPLSCTQPTQRNRFNIDTVYCSHTLLCRTTSSVHTHTYTYMYTPCINLQRPVSIATISIFKKHKIDQKRTRKN